MNKLIPLPGLIHLRFKGPDAERYLNGQVTQQIEGLNKGQSRYTFVCDAKGRILFDATIYADSEGFLLTVEGLEKEAVFARMDRYLIADDCELTDESEKWTLVHELNEVIENGETVNRFGKAGRDRYFTAEQLKELKQDDFALTTIAEQENYRLLAQVPRLVDLTGAFPAETGWEDQAVSFHKGCYLGQEVVSRIKRAGKTNRQLVPLSLPQRELNCPIFFTPKTSDKPLLEVTSVASQSENGAYPSLGYLSSRYVSGTELTSENGTVITLSI